MITDEQAKATQELAKTTGQFAEIAEKIGGFVSKLVGPTSEQIGGILGDWTRYYRSKNLLMIADKVEAINSRRRTQGKTTQIPLKIAVPLIESAALEDDEVLQDIWARLISNSIDPNFSTAIHPGYTEIIRQLSPDEAIILESFLKLESFPTLFSVHVPKILENEENSLSNRLWRIQQRGPSYEKLYEAYFAYCKTLALKKPEDSAVYVDNLIRLRIVEIGTDFTENEGSAETFMARLRRRNTPEIGSPSIAVPARTEFLRMTAFGQSFVAACIAENPYR